MNLKYITEYQVSLAYLMKKLYSLALLLSVIFASCDSPTDTKKSSSSRAQTTNDPKVFAQSITAEDLQHHLQIIASDEFVGRPPGSTKIKKYLRDFYRKEKIESPPHLKDAYYQTIPKEYIIEEFEKRAGRKYTNSLLRYKDELQHDANVIAYFKGKQNPEEVVIITAHMDHIGTTCDNPMKPCPGGKVNNGASDNASGTVALLEIAQAFQQAKESGNIPKRSVMFVHFALEETGLIGSQYYVENPVFDLEDTVLNLNVDCIGTVDSKEREIADRRNYIYIIGAKEISSELKSIHEEINKKYVDLFLDYEGVSGFLTRGDHYMFIKHGIPALFYSDKCGRDYHTPEDDADTINYEALAKRTKLVYHAAWEFANREKRLVRDREYIP